MLGSALVAQDDAGVAGQYILAPPGHASSAELLSKLLFCQIQQGEQLDVGTNQGTKLPVPARPRCLVDRAHLLADITAPELPADFVPQLKGDGPRHLG